MSADLVSADAAVVDGAVTVNGTYATEADRDAFVAAVEASGGDVVVGELVERPVADATAAATLEADLNDLVTEDPILFEPSSIEISAESEATIDRVAAIAGRVSGVAIVVEGHTDTDGVAESNQALSEGRARSVQNALIERGSRRRHLGHRRFRRFRTDSRQRRCRGQSSKPTSRIRRHRNRVVITERQDHPCRTHLPSSFSGAS